MGIGDWNDGMSLVGAGGRGESVWLGWFLVSLLRPFADVAEARGEADRAARYRAHAGKLTGALEDAWDGEWYRRAYFDDGTPLGSKENTECRIDAIAQSWAVISGAGEPARARQAMASTDRHLVREERQGAKDPPPCASGCRGRLEGLAAELALLSERSSHLHAESGDHLIHRSDPDLVIRGIADLVDQVRTTA